ncbi:hypothetical protein DV735_g176, partial [Chaetothyriales sp. CBS 134920]
MAFKTSGQKTRPERAKAGPHDDDDDTAFHDARFPREEEEAMVAASHRIKADANQQFGNADYGAAISTYDRAAAELPSYLDYELAVLQSNIAACHVKLGQWKEATEGQHESDVVELPSDAEEDELEQKLKELNLSDARKAEIKRIRTKLWLRRARARSSIEPATWANLGGALEDYQLLAGPEYFNTLPATDQRTVRQALVTLPPRVNEAKDGEVGEMMGKLKELGNGILRPFGLSTDMFKMTQGPDGGWSMNIDQTAGKGQ